MIPKIIHYCWLSDEPIPADMQKYINGWKDKLPDYEFILWNFKRFDINSSDCHMRNSLMAPPSVDMRSNINVAHTTQEMKCGR